MVLNSSGGNILQWGARQGFLWSAPFAYSAVIRSLIRMLSVKLRPPLNCVTTRTSLLRIEAGPPPVCLYSVIPQMQSTQPTMTVVNWLRRSHSVDNCWQRMRRRSSTVDNDNSVVWRHSRLEAALRFEYILYLKTVYPQGGVWEGSKCGNRTSVSQ